MKHPIWLILALCACSISFAQYENNYLQLTEVRSLYGDARFTSLGGAMSAVGSNVSAINNNPAGIARFVKTELNFGLGAQISSNTNLYEGNESRNSSTKLGGQSYGFILDVSKKGRTDGAWWFGLSGRRLNDFKNNNIYRVNDIDYTLLDAFADEAFGTPADAIFNERPFTAGLAYEAFLIDPDTVNFDTYTAIFNRENARFETDENGRRYENNISIGYNSNNKIYLGASIGILSATYENTFVYFGENVNAEFEPAQNYTYRNFYIARSTGVNVGLGIIYRPSKVLNLGLGYTTPSYWFVNETFSADIASEFNSFPDEFILSPFEGIGRYKVATPAKLNLSAAITDKTFGLFAVELTNLNYKNGELIAYNNNNEFIDFTNNNAIINENLRSVWQIAIGYEKPFKSFALRVGYNRTPTAFEGNDGFLNYTVNNISAGFGFYTKFGRLDFALVSSNGTRTLQPYGGADIAVTESSNLLFNASVSIIQF